MLVAVITFEPRSSKLNPLMVYAFLTAAIIWMFVVFAIATIKVFTPIINILYIHYTITSICSV